MADSDSDSDLGAFAFMGKKIVIEESDDDIETTSTSIEKKDFISQMRNPEAIDKYFMARNIEALEGLLTKAKTSHQNQQVAEFSNINAESDNSDNLPSSAEEIAVLQMAVDILQGKHLEVVQRESGSFSLANFLTICKSDMCVASQIRDIINAHTSAAQGQRAMECRLRHILLLGVAWLDLYCQENYTGPELNPVDVAALYGYGYGTEIAPNGSRRQAATLKDEEEADIVQFKARCVQHLEVDGAYVFSMCQLPHALLLARSLLAPLADPQRAPWKAGVQLAADGSLLKRTVLRPWSDTLTQACNHLRCSVWLSARACMIHARALLRVSVDTVPTLWKEVCDMFHDAKIRYSADSHATTGEADDDSLVTQLWIECGLSYHHFDHQDKGKLAFKQAQRASGLQTVLTGALGKRTKHQKKDYAQMLLLVRSAFLEGRGGAALVDPNAGEVPDDSYILKGKGLGGLDLEDVDVHSGLATRRVTAAELAEEEKQEKTSVYRVGEGWEHGQWEVGRRLVVEGQNGQEAAVREVLLDSCDGGATENILLEGGPQYKDAAFNHTGKLHVVDQAVLLALCLDVTNSNADEGLTREEKEPYLYKVLQDAQSWMIHSTGLLERSWLEFERSRTADRAMLQMQALLDQHTTKLTVMQSTFKSITEDSAPVHERLSFLHCIVYPAQYELKRDLAQRYLRCQVVASALGYFRELEMWDEVVTCYQLMDKPQRAEMVVRERLKVSRTPYMVCALADLTTNEQLYEDAWELSHRRYARAKRTLGKICFDRGDYEACMIHMEAALTVAPLVPTAWYLKGVAAMRLEKWESALLSFSRCVQQDMEIGEAWANSGSIHMRLGEHASALMAFEQAYKHKRDSWRLIENMMGVCLLLNKFQEVIHYMGLLLDMREKSLRPVHKPELRRLCYMAAVINRKTVREKNAVGTQSASGTSSFQVDMRKLLEDDQDEFLFVSNEDLDRTCTDVEKLLQRITSTIDSDPEVWDIYADFEISLGRLPNVLACRVRQFRGLLNEVGWEKHLEKVTGLVKSAKALYAVHDTAAASKTDLYACRSMLQTARAKVVVLFSDSAEYSLLNELIDQVTKLHDAKA